MVYLLSNVNFYIQYILDPQYYSVKLHRHGKISQLVEIRQECLYVLSARSCFCNGKCNQLSDW